jgi:cytochrome P450 family 619
MPTRSSETTASTLITFVQAMLAFPEVQKKAHAEIDAVVGNSRMPTWADYNSLPYVAMIVKETMRWRPTAPVAFPHAMSEGTLAASRACSTERADQMQMSGSTAS